MPFNSTNPVVVGAATKKGDYDRVFDNTVALRAGEIALASQAQYDLMVASSATQWGRIPLAQGVLYHATGAGSNPAFATTITLATITATTQVKAGQSGLAVLDTDNSHYMEIGCTSNLSLTRSLSFAPGDASRIVTLSGNPTLADWFDQSVKQSASPTFQGLTVTAASTLNISVTMAVGGSDSILFDAAAGFNIISLINATSTTANVGIRQGATAADLYLMASLAGAFHFLSNGVETLLVADSGSTFKTNLTVGESADTKTLTVHGATTLNTSVTMAIGGTSSILVDNNGNYGVISLANSNATSNNLAIFGGATGDPNSLYLVAKTTGSIVLRVNATDYFALSASDANFAVGITVGAPTGGNKGGGTINVATDIYRNNALYAHPDYVFERWATGRIERFTGNPGADRYTGLLPLPALEAFVREHYHFPLIPRVPMGAFERSDVALALIEENTLYLFDHERRLRALEARCHS